MEAQNLYWIDRSSLKNFCNFQRETVTEQLLITTSSILTIFLCNLTGEWGSKEKDYQGGIIGIYQWVVELSFLNLFYLHCQSTSSPSSRSRHVFALLLNLFWNNFSKVGVS
jgi:hypothetical protein